MRRFSSYGPIDIDLHYYVPREKILANAYTQLVGEHPEKGGHYITVWAPRQTGKTWVMQQVLFRLQHEQQSERFDVAKINLQHLKREQDTEKIVASISNELARKLGQELGKVTHLEGFQRIFARDVLNKPLLLILDEFDALAEDAINGIADVFRNMYISRRDQFDKSTAEKEYLLHGVALIGVRSVLGIENVTGSPFNVQRSLHIPNLTFEEVDGMFTWYERESGQHVEQEVIERLYYETNGHPGLTCWFGELLTETYNEHHPIITLRDFEVAYAAATDALPNNTILNIISKAKQDPCKPFVLELFKTEEKIPFKYDDSVINFLYLNGVVDWELVDKTRRYVKFSCPFVQKRLFNYFSYELFRVVGELYEPFESLADTITDTGLNINNLLMRYQRYLHKNRHWLLDNAPRRKDLRIYEAVYHFTLYMFLQAFLRNKKGEVYPEFPTGNGQIDLIIKYRGQVYGLEVKSYTDESDYQDALRQAARYGKHLKLDEISLAFFVESVDEANRTKYEQVYVDDEMGVTVRPIFVEIGSRE